MSRCPCYVLPLLEDAARHRFGLTDALWRSLRGKRFWLTGAGTGLGRCIALGLLAAGAHVVLSGRRAALYEGFVELTGLAE